MHSLNFLTNNIHTQCIKFKHFLYINCNHECMHMLCLSAFFKIKNVFFPLTSLQISFISKKSILTEVELYCDNWFVFFCVGTPSSWRSSTRASVDDAKLCLRALSPCIFLYPLSFMITWSNDVNENHKF